ILVEDPAGYGRIVVVGRVKELVGGVLDDALWAGADAEWLLWHGGQLAGGLVDDPGGDAVLGLAGSGVVVALVGDVDPASPGLDEELGRVGEGRVVRDGAAGLG